MKIRSVWHKGVRSILHLVLLFAFIISTPLQAAAQAAPEDRNFGFFMVQLDEQLQDMPEAYTTWIRMGGVVVWGLVEEEPGSGMYDFSTADKIIEKAKSRNLQLIFTVDPQHQLDDGASQKALPTDMPAYKAFLGAFVERYDGDGVEDAPGSPVIRHWQIGNEPDNETNEGEKVSWNDTPENYAALLKESTEVIREANPGALVLMAGMVTGEAGLDNFYETVFSTLDSFGGDPYFDIFDVHWFADIVTGAHYRALGDAVDAGRASIAAHGYGNIPVWATEVANYSGSPEGYEPMSEDAHASALAKMLLYYRSLDIEKVLWAPYKEFHDWREVPNGYFDNTGLVNNELNDGQYFKKRAYYTYRFLSDKADGAVFLDDSTLVEMFNKSGVRFCEFTNYYKTYYAFWVDNYDKVGFELSIPTDAAAFKLYTLVPDNNNEIIPVTVPSSGGAVNVTLDFFPVLAEYVGAGPSLEIVSPMPGMLTNLAALELNGITDPFEGVLLEVPYRVPAQIGQADSDGNFSFSDIPLAEGDNVLIVTVGSGDYTSIETVHVILDTIPSNISVSHPVDESALNTPSLAIKGFVDPGQVVTLDDLPGGIPMSVTGDLLTGEYVFPVVVFPGGPNLIRVSTEDAVGNMSEISLSFLIDTQPPQITNFLREDVFDETGPYEVHATVTDNDRIYAVYLNYIVDGGETIDVPMVLQNGNVFRAEIPGQLFGTPIAYYVKAFDRGGNIDRKPEDSNVTFRVIDRVAPVITGTTVLLDTDNTQDPYEVYVTVTDNTQLASVTLFYRTNNNTFIDTPMTGEGDGLYRAEIPPQPLFTLVGYGIIAMDTFGNRVYDPPNLPQELYDFRVAPWGTQEAAVQIAPANNQVLPGQPLSVDFALHNFTYTSQTIIIRISITAPNGRRKDLPPLTVTLPPAVNLSLQQNYPVPANTPAGMYYFSAAVYNPEGVELGMDEFSFYVIH